MSDCRPIFTAVLGLALSVGCLAGALCPAVTAPPAEAPELAADYLAPHARDYCRSVAKANQAGRYPTGAETLAMFACWQRYVDGTCGGDLECETFYGGSY